MARFSMADEACFIPTYGGNDKEVEPVKFYYRTPNHKLREDLLPKTEFVTTFDAEGNRTGGQASMKVSAEKVVYAMLIRAEGIQVDVEGKKDPVLLTTASDLYGRYCPIPVSKMVQEFYARMMEILRATDEDGAEKN